MKAFCGNELVIGQSVIWAKTARSGADLTPAVVIGFTPKQQVRIEVSDWRGTKRLTAVHPLNVVVPR
ncbi:hypothetical protein AB6806_23815 [Bosea sp. RCC_152_1]|uniref:hypothetical protein n=1 Tax=Bosea sp. RCC_152_1 TaxID=3239228 RepID=UPI0035247A35